jgi:hypothetical protein
MSTDIPLEQLCRFIEQVNDDHRIFVDGGFTQKGQHSGAALPIASSALSVL